MNFDIMKKPNIAVMVLLPFLLASCGPLSYTVGVELRQFNIYCICVGRFCTEA